MAAGTQIKDEYSTYPPGKSRCSECGEEFRPLVPARRFQRADEGSTAVSYRHFECGEEVAQ